MDDLTILKPGTLTMSSREIAELVGVRHDNVMRSCRALLDDGVCPQIEETPYINQQNGQAYREFLMNKRDSLVLVARLSPEFTARVVDRWQELEAQAAPAFDPASLSRLDILRLALESEQGRLLAIGERDEAIRTKALIGTKREATAMATASVARRELARLRGELGFNQHHATVLAVERATGKSLGPQCWRDLRRWCESHGITARSVADNRYGSVKAWPAEAWQAVYGIDLVAVFGAEELAT